MAGHKKHKRMLQILIIPDDKDEPKTYSIPIQRLKLFKILAALLVAHFVIGIFAYYKYFQVSAKNGELIEINRQLEENNNRIYELAEAFENLETSQAKIKSMLGLSKSEVEQLTMDTRVPMPTYIPDARKAPSPRSLTPQSQEQSAKEKIAFLTRSKSFIHDLERSIPTYLPVEGVLTADYEEGRMNSGRPHRGIDIGAERGKLVHAAADGVVIFSGWTHDLGNLIIIYHGDGFFTYYGHNQELLRTRNSFVKKGDPIARLGSSGHSSAPHLHFEIWRDGVPLDPKDYILAFSGL